MSFIDSFKKLLKLPQVIIYIMVLSLMFLSYPYCVLAQASDAEEGGNSALNSQAGTGSSGSALNSQAGTGSSGSALNSQAGTGSSGSAFKSVRPVQALPVLL